MRFRSSSFSAFSYLKVKKVPKLSKTENAAIFATLQPQSSLNAEL